MDFELISLIRAVGIFQGLLLGVILIFSSKKNKSTLFLGLFLIGFSVEFLPEFLSDLRLLNYNPRQLLFLLNLSWILFPLFFIYVQRISIIPKDKITYWVIYPGLFAVILHLILGMVDRNFTNWLLENTYVYQILYCVSLIYSLYVIYRIVILIKEHKEEVRNQYAQPENRLLEWTSFFAFFCFALVATRILALFMDQNEILDILLAGFNIVIIALIAISGIFQYNVFNALSHTHATEETAAVEQAAKPLTETKAREILDKMDKLMSDSRMFLIQDLTVTDVAQELGEHPRNISLALNNYYKKNFNSYINGYRIREAEKLLKEGYTESMSIEGLSQEVGFRSKTSFYRSFKEHNGMTPIEFVRKKAS